MTQPRYFQLERDIALPRADVWELLAHTEHFNRAIGLPEVQFAPMPPDAIYREARAKLAGQNLRYREYPFQWVKYEEFAVRRLFDAGPLREFNGGIRLRDGEENGHTHLTVFAEITPANPLGAAIVPVVAQRSLRQTWEYCQKFLQSRNNGVAFSLPPPQSVPHVEASHFDFALQQLKRQPRHERYAPLAPDIVQHLAQWLRKRGDDEVAALRPFHLAREWNAAPEETLRVCLYATKVGLLTLSWNLMCPNCRVSKAEHETMAEISSQFHCDLCGVEYSANFDRFVELRFRVHPNIRNVHSGTYCVGGPYISPHVLIQKIIAPQTTTHLTLPSLAHPLRLRVLRANHSVEFDNEGAALETLIYAERGWAHDKVLRPAPGDSLGIENQTNDDIIVVLEKIDWDALAVTAAKVTTMAEFRDLFGSEVLAPGQHVGIENLTLFFSDLKDSTELYERSGDAPAYGCVRNHFTYLSDHIAHNAGSVVKTIGDAVMAVFYSPENAVRAALEIQKNIHQFNQSMPDGHAVTIKMGLHFGPAIAVNSNDRLDYFGRTVNLAARIQDASRGQDVVMSDSVFERPDVQKILQEYPLRSRKFEANLKGIEGVFTLYQVQLK